MINETRSAFPRYFTKLWLPCQLFSNILPNSDHRVKIGLVVHIIKRGFNLVFAVQLTWLSGNLKFKKLCLSWHGGLQPPVLKVFGQKCRRELYFKLKVANCIFFITGIISNPIIKQSIPFFENRSLHYVFAL